MRAAAQFHRVARVGVPAHAEYPNFVAIFLPEQRHRALRNRLIGGHQARGHGLVVADVPVHLGLDRSEVVGGQRGIVAEVEAQAVGGDQAALLGDVLTKAMAERGVEQVRRAVVRPRGAAAVLVDLLMERVADRDAPDRPAHRQDVQFAELLGRVGDIPAEASWVADLARVADLPAALGVEGRLVKQ